jgi:hypothetical protein
LGIQYQYHGNNISFNIPLKGVTAAYQAVYQTTGSVAGFPNRPACKKTKSDLGCSAPEEIRAA